MSQLMDYYKAIEDSSAGMLDAARREDWDAVLRYESACAVLIGQLRFQAQLQPLRPEQRREKSRIMQRILRNDARIRCLAEPWLARCEQLLADRLPTLHRKRRAAGTRIQAHAGPPTTSSDLHVHDVGVGLHHPVAHIQGGLKADLGFLDGDHGFFQADGGGFCGGLMDCSAVLKAPGNPASWPTAWLASCGAAARRARPALVSGVARLGGRRAMAVSPWAVVISMAI